MIKFFRKIRQRLLTNNKFSKYLLYAIGEIILVVIGILLALSTTIFGAVDGYFLRLVKSLTMGNRVKAYSNQLAEQQAASVQHVLQAIDERLSQVVSLTEKPNQDGR